MPLLGGAVKLASAHTAGVPAFTGDPYSVNSVTAWPGGPNAAAQIRVDVDGFVYNIRAGIAMPSIIGSWDNGLGTLSKDDYQFRLDTITGTIDFGDSVDVWLPASLSDDFWEVQEDFGIKTFTGTLRVRLATSPFTEYDTASVTLEAERTP